MPDTSHINYRNRFNRHIWLTECKKDIKRYFDSRQIVRGNISKEPIWMKVPLTSIWVVQSVGTPGFHGWFVVTGDHPTDIVGMGGVEGAKDALVHFSNKWQRAANILMEGEDYPDFRIENIEDRPKIGWAISQRAEAFKELAMDLA